MNSRTWQISPVCADVDGCVVRIRIILGTSQRPEEERVDAWDEVISPPATSVSRPEVRLVMLGAMLVDIKDLRFFGHPAHEDIDVVDFTFACGAAVIDLLCTPSTTVLHDQYSVLILSNVSAGSCLRLAQAYLPVLQKPDKTAQHTEPSQPQ